MHAYEVIGLLYTRTCPLACEHCIIESSPKAKDKMQLSAAMEMLPAIASYAPSVCFTGGEPLLYYREIIQLLRASKAFGLATRLVSGAGWVRSRAVAEERIAQLQEAGLDKLCVSADRYHEKYSPRERAHLLIDVATRAGLPVMVRGVIPATLNSSEEKARFAPTNVPYDPVPLVRLGAARNLPNEQFYSFDGPPQGRCPTALSPVVEPDGNVYACCGPARFANKQSPLVLGNTNNESLGEILSRSSIDPLFKAISLIGPYGVLELLKTHPGGQHASAALVRKSYTGMCELCLDLTDSLEAVAAIRSRLNDSDARALLTVAELWAAQRRKQSVAVGASVPQAFITNKELPHVTPQHVSSI